MRINVMKIEAAQVILSRFFCFTSDEEVTYFFDKRLDLTEGENHDRCH